MTPTLGFASNLSHTIIREAQEDDDRSTKSQGTDSTNISISDEELALLGAPWAKEGMLCRKQFWEVTGKKAKTRSWMDVFVVIQRGEMNMFTFGERGSGGSGVVGGGNWLVIALLFPLFCTVLIAGIGKRATSGHSSSSSFTGACTSSSGIQ
jgi:PH/SEC7 domain-containing protein